MTSNVFNLTDHLPQPEVFDRDNPPSRMSQLIRLSIRDVESMLAQGYGYDWHSSSLRQWADSKRPDLYSKRTKPRRRG